MKLALLLLLAPAAACGYRVESYRGHETGAEGALPAVAVLPFDNDTFRRGLEIRLSRQVADELRSRGGRTPATPSEAEWSLSGTVVLAEEQVLSEDRQDEVRESSFVITVRVVLKERATERELGAYSITESEPFSLRAGRVATLGDAEGEALRDLAEGIVNWLESRNRKAPS